MVAWTSNQTFTNSKDSMLNLVNGQKYYVSVRAVNGAGLKSPKIATNGVTIDITNGVAMLDQLSAISMYPNPAIDEFTIAFETMNSNAKIEIINNLGQTVSTDDADAQAGSIRYHVGPRLGIKMATGIYTVVVKANTVKGNRIMSKRIVIAEPGKFGN